MDKERQSGSQEAKEAHPSTNGARPILHLPRKAPVGNDLHHSAANDVESDNPGDCPLADTAEGSAEPAVDKFASCEVSPASDELHEPPTAADDPVAASDMTKAASSAVSVLPPTEPEQVPAPKSGLELEIDRCTALGEKSDPMLVERWGKRGAPILEQSLRFLAVYEAASKEEQQASRKTLKLKSGVSREPNAGNLPVIAVYLCVSCSGRTQTKRQRKEWCRFATVVRVAAAASVSPDEAAKWVEKKTLKGILAEWKVMKSATGAPSRKAAVPTALKEYKHLAAALQRGSEFHALAKTELAKANAAIIKAMEQAAALPNIPKQEPSQAENELTDA